MDKLKPRQLPDSKLICSEDEAVERERLINYQVRQDGQEFVAFPVGHPTYEAQGATANEALSQARELMRGCLRRIPLEYFQDRPPDSEKLKHPEEAES